MATDPVTNPPFRIIPPGTNYPGLTGLSIGDRREIVCMGTGPAVEAALVEAKGRKR